MESDRLASYPFIVVRIACAHCPRRGSYRLARLAERYGADMAMDNLLTLLSGDCALRGYKRLAGSYRKCGAHFPDLLRPLPPDLPPGMLRLRMLRGGKA